MPFCSGGGDFGGPEEPEEPEEPEDPEVLLLPEVAILATAKLIFGTLLAP